LCWIVRIVNAGNGAGGAATTGAGGGGGAQPDTVPIAPAANNKNRCNLR
jgi:hypothetical protein